MDNSIALRIYWYCRLLTDIIKKPSYNVTENK
jgi:hypothetical protein